MDCRFAGICEIRKSCETRQSNRKHLEMHKCFKFLSALKALLKSTSQNFADSTKTNSKYLPFLSTLKPADKTRSKSRDN